MYNCDFVATDSADWAVGIEFYDATGSCENEDLVPDSATFELAVRNRNGGIVLQAATASGTITRPSPSTITWRFTREQMAPLCDGTVYSVGLVMTTDTGTVQLLVGSLSFIDGVVS